MKHPTIYWQGNKAAYTGRTTIIYRGTFYEIKLLEGHEKGKLKLTIREPK